LRQRLQVFIDRRFYRRKYDAARAVAAFNTRLREEVDLAALTTGLCAVIDETMQPASISLWLRPPESARVGATHEVNRGVHEGVSGAGFRRSRQRL
jgi:hypothetical protein